MSNYTVSNLIPTISGKGRIPAIKIGDQVFPVQVAGQSYSYQASRAGVIVIQNGDLKVQPLKFSGSTPSDDGAAQNFTLKIFDTGRPQIDYIQGGVSASLASGFILSGVTIGPQDTITVKSGASVNDIVISSDGIMYISSGGVMGDILVQEGGLLLSDGAVISRGSVSNWPQQPPLGSAVIISNAASTISAADEINGAALEGVGISMFVFSGGIANSTIVQSAAKIKTYGGVINNTTVSWGTVSVFDGLVSNTVLESNGTMTKSGGTAVSTLVNPGGYLSVGTEIGSTIDIIENGGYVEDRYVRRLPFTFTSDWNVVSFASNMFSGVTVNGSATVHSGTTAFQPIVNSEGRLYVYSGGIVSGGTITPSGKLYVSEGGTAAEVILSGNPGDTYNTANLYVLDGGTANSCICYSRGRLQIGKGAVANGIVVNSGGSVKLIWSGLLTSALVNEGGDIYVDRGVVNNIVVNTAGFLYIARRGTANNTLVSGGTLRVAPGAKANSITIEDGGILKVISNPSPNSKGAVISNVLLNSGGSFINDIGGIAYNITQNGGYVGGSAGLEVFSPNTFSNLVLNHTDATVHSGTTASNTTINSGGCLYVYKGGTANNITVNSDGSLYIKEVGTATNIILSSGWNLYVASGGTAKIAGDPWSSFTSEGNITADPSAVIIISPENNVYYGTADAGLLSKWNTIQNFEVAAGHSLVVIGAVAESITVGTDAGLFISSGGTVNHITVSAGGSIYVYSDGTAASAVISSGGTIYVSSGGIVNSAEMLDYNCSMHVSGGTVTNVSGSGSLTILGDGARAADISIHNSMRCSSGAVVQRVFVGSGGVMIASGCTATEVDLEGWQSSYWGQDWSFPMSKTAGRLWIFAGGSVTSITVPWAASVYVGSGGYANYVSVGYSGTLHAMSGAEVANIISGDPTAQIQYQY